MQVLHPWSAGSSERKWAISITVACFIILITLPFWPEKERGSSEKKLPAVALTSKQEPVAPIQKDPPKKTLKPALSQAKQNAKKAAAPVTTRITTPAPTQKTQKNAPPISSKAYFIQVGAFQSHSHAQKLQRQLIKKHWPVIIQKKKRLYAVQIGPYKHKEKANSIKTQLSHKEKLNGFVTHHVYP